MDNFKFIELPKEEVLSEVELSYIEGANNCESYKPCNGMRCLEFNSGPCSDTGGCGAILYCQSYTA